MNFIVETNKPDAYDDVEFEQIGFKANVWEGTRFDDGDGPYPVEPRWDFKIVFHGFKSNRYHFSIKTFLDDSTYYHIIPDADDNYIFSVYADGEANEFTSYDIPVMLEFVDVPIFKASIDFNQCITQYSENKNRYLKQLDTPSITVSDKTILEITSDIYNFPETIVDKNTKKQYAFQCFYINFQGYDVNSNTDNVYYDTNLYNALLKGGYIDEYRRWYEYGSNYQSNIYVSGVYRLIATNKIIRFNTYSDINITDVKLIYHNNNSEQLLLHDKNCFNGQIIN